MRNKLDILSNNCDKCKKITKEGDLGACDINGQWEGLALCPKCYKEVSKS